MAADKHIKFINSDDGTEISTTNLKVALPNGYSFFIESEPGREGSAVFFIPGGNPEDPVFQTFSIEPGASNLFSVNVVQFARRSE
jgi:hypothetical protein